MKFKAILFKLVIKRYFENILFNWIINSNVNYQKITLQKEAIQTSRMIMRSLYLRSLKKVVLLTRMKAR